MKNSYRICPSFDKYNWYTMRGDSAEAALLKFFENNLTTYDCDYGGEELYMAVVRDVETLEVSHFVITHFFGWEFDDETDEQHIYNLFSLESCVNTGMSTVERDWLFKDKKRYISDEKKD